MNNSRNYRRSIVLLILLVALLLASVFLASIFRLAVAALICWVALGLIGAAGFLAVGHLRMRMVFEAINRHRREIEQLHGGSFKSFEERLSHISEQMALSVDSNRRVDEHGLVDRLDGFERELLANDSFSEARAVDIGARMSSLSNHLKNARTESESRFNEISGGVLECKQSLSIIITKLDQVTHEMKSAVTDGENSIGSLVNTEVNWVRPRISSLVSVVQSISHTLTSIVGIRSDISELGNSISELSTEMQSFFGESEKRQGVVVDEIVKHIRELEGSLELMVASMSRVEVLTDQSSHLVKSAEHSSRSAKNEVLRVAESQISLERFLNGAEDLLSPLIIKVQDSIDGLSSDLDLRLRNGSGSAEGYSSTNSRDVAKSDNRLQTEIELGEPSASMNGEARALAAQAQKFFNATQNKLQYQRAAIEELPRDINDYARLLNRFGVDPLLCPDVGGWSATIPVIRTLVAEILSAPDGDFYSLDIGAGTSTFWEALAMRERGGGRCYALEHDPIYADRLTELLDAHDLGQWVEVVTVPLVEWEPKFEYPVDHTHIPTQWYDLGNSIAHPIGLVFVDGPPGDGGVYSRLPAFESVEEYLSDTSVLVMDDTLRAEEREIVKLWQSLPTGKGSLQTEENLLKATKLSYSRGRSN